MSLIATLLSGQKPTLKGFSTIFRVDQYRDNLVHGADTLEMSDQEFRRQKAAKRPIYDPMRNKTDKADANYLKALRNGPLTVKELVVKANREKSQVQRQVRVLEAKGLIKQVGKKKNGSNAAIIWGLV